jgi:mannosyl-oligosaccharide alpha-1,2-mannosidase
MKLIRLTIKSPFFNRMPNIYYSLLLSLPFFLAALSRESIMYFRRRRFFSSIMISCAVLLLWYLQLIPDVLDPQNEYSEHKQSGSDGPIPASNEAHVAARHILNERPAFQKPLHASEAGDDGAQLGSAAPLTSSQDEDQTHRREIYPVESIRALPTGKPIRFPTVQYEFPPESPDARTTRLERRGAIKANLKHTWDSYRTYAWMKDELLPVGAGFRTSFGGWAATLVDSLDTLWIMGMTEEFEEAVASLDDIDFTVSESDVISLFETTIRYLGGLLGAYDISNEKYPILLKKAVDLGEMLYGAFDTPNRMPIPYWHFKVGDSNVEHQSSDRMLLADLGSLSMEFTRLSQLTGDAKYFDAISRITDVLEMTQNHTSIPGLWPTILDARTLKFTGSGFTLGGMADSVYEYLPKQHILLGGLSEQYQNLYSNAIAAIKKHVFFRPMTPGNADILISGSAHVDGSAKGSRIEPTGQHLACFTGGMVGIASKLIGPPEDLAIARKLVEGCIWAYNATITGIMPEIFHLIASEDADNCEWDEMKWHKAVLEQNHGAGDDNKSVKERAEELIKKDRLPPGFSHISERKYILRPEAIESVFILYRLTGDPALPEAAWRMWNAIEKHTRTEIANAAILDVTVENPQKDDRMESFWPAETLKYFYLIFSEPDLVNLDEFVL